MRDSTMLNPLSTGAQIESLALRCSHSLFLKKNMRSLRMSSNQSARPNGVSLILLWAFIVNAFSERMIAVISSLNMKYSHSHKVKRSLESHSSSLVCAITRRRLINHHCWIWLMSICLIIEPRLTTNTDCTLQDFQLQSSLVSIPMSLQVSLGLDPGPHGCYQIQVAKPFTLNSVDRDYQNCVRLYGPRNQ